MPPIIGLTTYGYRENHTVSLHYHHHYIIPKDYVDAVTRAGGIPLLIPPNDTDWKALWPVLDGIIVTGGTDVAPQFYNGDAQNSKIHADAPERDVAEIALIQNAIATKDKPVLCICRGMQVLNVALGGTMYAHIPDIRELDIHRNEEGLWTRHDCYIEAGSQLAYIMGEERVNTYSGHHQAVHLVAKGLQVVATAPDGIIEALTFSEHPWLLGVQWHPEKSAATDPTQQRLFEELVNAAKKPLHS
jgi:putative glutamine amidotransferase